MADSNLSQMTREKTSYLVGIITESNIFRMAVKKWGQVEGLVG